MRPTPASRLAELRREGSRARLILLAGILLFCPIGFAAEPTPLDFGALEKAGAVIGEIRVDTQNIFDLDIPAEDNRIYRMVNRLHIITRPQVIAGMLLFKSGDKVSLQKINETERLLRTLRIIHDVEFRPVAYDGTKVDVEVTTRDTWTLDFTGSYSRAGGDNKASFGIRERNLLGTGIGVGFGRTSNVDRQGTELEVAYNQAFDGWTQLAYSRGRFDDGKRTALVIDRPFYSFDTRRAARAAWIDEDRIDPIYNAGELVSEFRHHLKAVDLSAGWSPGLVDGFTERYSVGAFARDDAYRQEPARIPTVPLPVDHDVRAPFVRYEVLEDEFVKVKNYNRIERPEFLGLGFNAYAQLARSLPALGSTISEWLYAAGVSNGTTLNSGVRLLGKATVERRIASTATPLTQGGIAVQAYAPRRTDSLFYVSLLADHVSGGGVPDQLLIGGTLGLRGYPSRYQAGENRVLLTVEKRLYSDWYPFRLLRVGGAAFFDSGRAWGGPNQNTVNGGWLSDVGVGLRLAVDRAAFANVLHLDVAVPLNRAPGIKSVQFLVKTEFGF